MSATETITKINAALNVFAVSTNKQDIANANEWLQDFQHTVEAWDIASRLILSPDSPDVVRTFAAQTLKSKVVYDLAQLSSEQLPLLRETLVSALQRFSAGPRNVLVQICLSLSGLAIQMADWAPTAVQDLIDNLGTDPASVPGLLQFLAVLPDDINTNTRIPLSDDEYRTRSGVLLTENGPRILNLLTMYLQAPGITVNIQNLIFEVLSNWVIAGEITATALAQTDLFDFAFDALSSQDLFETAAELLCELIHETQELEDNMAVIERIVPRLIALQPQLLVDKDDGEKLRLWARIYTEAGETYRMLIIQHTETFLPLVQAISECAANEDLDVVKITFTFWYRLGQTLGKQRTISPVITEVYKSVLDNFIRHIHFPPDIEQTTAEDAEEFRNFRHDIGDVIKDCSYVLGADYALERIYAQLTVALSQVGGNVSWQEIEAPLFCLRSLGGEIDWTQQHSKILQIMSVLPNLPPHPRVRYAATMLISRYTPWVAKHPDYIPEILVYIQAGFENSDLEVISAAGCALKYLCCDCKQQLVPYLSQLDNFLSTVGYKLMQEDKLVIYESIGWVIASMPMELAATTLRKFVGDIFGTIQAAMQAKRTKDITDSLEYLEKLLDVVGAFGEELPQACRDNAPAESWAVLNSIISNYGAVPDICDRSTRVLRYGLQLFDRAGLILVPDILARISTTFEATGFASYLWAISKVIQRFGLEEDESVRSAISESYARITAKCASIFAASDIRLHSDIVDDYLSALTPLLEQCPDILFLSPAYSTSFSILIASLGLLNTDTTFYALGLIRAILSHDCLLMVNSNGPVPPNFPLYASAISSSVTKDGALLVAGLFGGMLDHFSPETMGGVITTVRILTQFWTSEMQSWVPTVLRALSLPPALESAREKFISDFNEALATGDLDKLKPAITSLQRSVLRAKDRRRPLDR